MGLRETPLVGRAHEQKAFRNVLDAVRDGMSGTLVFRGEAGIGKTALLDGVVEAAPDLDVFRIDGVEYEISRRFAALHQVLHRRLGGWPYLTAPQADRVIGAF